MSGFRWRRMADWLFPEEEGPAAKMRHEYRCPHCGRINVRHEPCARLVCDSCENPFHPLP